MKHNSGQSTLRRGQESIAWAVWKTTAAGIFIVLPLMYLNPGNDDLLTTLFYAPVIALVVSIYWLLKTDRLRPAGFLLTTLFFGISTGATVIMGGVHIAVTGSYFICIMTAAAILGTRAAVATAVLSCSMLLVLGLFQAYGMLPEATADRSSMSLGEYLEGSPTISTTS